MGEFSYGSEMGHAGEGEVAWVLCNSEEHCRVLPEFVGGRGSYGGSVAESPCPGRHGILGRARGGSPTHTSWGHGHRSQ